MTYSVDILLPITFDLLQTLQAQISQAWSNSWISPKAILNEADFQQSSLQGIWFTACEAEGADFSGARLHCVQLEHADLKRSSFHGSEISNAEFGGVFVHRDFASGGGANLTSVDFHGAKLTSCSFHAAKLNDCDFTNAEFGVLTFSNTDLSTVRGLDSVTHHRPSNIGIETLFRSHPNLTDDFLRGCGVPEDLIGYLPSLARSPFDFYSCFISYSHHDEEYAHRLHSQMQVEKLRVLYAPADMRGGKKSYPQIDEAIRLHDKLLLVLTANSMASEWVATEIRRARQAEVRDGRQKLFPIRVCDMQAIKNWECFDADTGKDLAVEIREYHIPDFSDWKNYDSFETAFASLIRDLRSGD